MSLKCARFRTVTHRQPGGTDYRAELAPGDPRLLYEAVRKLQTGHKHEFTHSMMADKRPTEALRARGRGTEGAHISQELVMGGRIKKTTSVGEGSERGTCLGRWVSKIIFSLARNLPARARVHARGESLSLTRYDHSRPLNQNPACQLSIKVLLKVWPRSPITNNHPLNTDKTGVTIGQKSVRILRTASYNKS